MPTDLSPATWRKHARGTTAVGCIITLYSDVQITARSRTRSWFRARIRQRSLNNYKTIEIQPGRNHKANYSTFCNYLCVRVQFLVISAPRRSAARAGSLHPPHPNQRRAVVPRGCGMDGSGRADALYEHTDTHKLRQSEGNKAPGNV